MKKLLIIFMIVVCLSGCKQNKKTVYIIKEFDNQVVLYKNDKIIEDTKIVITSLPRKDAIMIKKGITVKSYKEAQKIIENYES